MFAKHTIARFTATMLAAGALGAGAFATAATAWGATFEEAGSLNGMDKQFINTIEEVGVTYNSPDDAIHDAGVVCQALDDGTEPDAILESYLDASDGLSVDQGKAFIVASVESYCPEYLA